MALNHLIAGTTITAALIAGALALRPDHALAVPPPTPVAITTTPLPLNRDDPAQDSIGKLKFLGAVQMRSTNADFGAVSALRAGKPTRDGIGLIGVTDTGHWITLDTIERDGRLVGVGDVQMVAIRGADGAAAHSKADGDAEALEWNPATGAATIAYEQDHRLAHFTGIDPGNPATLTATPTRIERLTPMTGWPLNGGGEAMAELPGGARIVISERRERPDGSHVALLTQNGATREIAIAGVPDHSPTDAVALDATRILVLHRRFDMMGQGAAISLVDLAPALNAPAAEPLPATLLARWRAPETLDNMEGLAIRRDGERVFLYVVSDDNLNSLQRSLLMKFELLP